MPAKAKAKSDDALGLERLVFFSDAVMAIAITLLAVDLKVPEIDPSRAVTELPKQIAALQPSLMTFFISFIVIGIYWMQHHQYFGYIRRYNRQLLWLNLMFLFFIACMPFLSSLLGHYSSVPLTLIAYTLAIAALGFSMALIWLYASRGHRLIDPHLDTDFIRTSNIRLFVAPIMFLVAVPFAYVSSTAVITVWWLSPLVVIAANRLLTRKQK